MDQEGFHITICMGSSCFSRGNKKILQAVSEYLSENNLSAGVIFKGAHCMGQCEHGPVMKIGERVFHHLQVSSVSQILDDFFSSLKHDPHAHH